MPRRGMPKKSKPAAKEPESPAPTTPEVFGGVREETKDPHTDAPIILTRSDPNFEAREMLAEKLWQEEKHNMLPINQPEPEEDEEPEKPEEDDKDESEDTPEAEEAVEDEPEEAEEDSGDVEEEGEEPEEDEQDTLVIDGKEIKKSKREVYEAGKKALQKELSADRRLEEATRLLNETRAMATGRLPNQGVDPNRQLRPVPTKEQQQQIKDLYEKLRYGDDDEGQAALQELLEGRTKATPQMEEILYGVGMYLERERIRTSFTTAPEQGGYADIYPAEAGGKNEDPEVWEFFDYKVNQLLNAGEPQALPTYQKAAESVRKRFGLGAKPKSSLDAKRERKREIDVVKGVKAKTPPPKKDKEESHADIIAWHRAQRR